MIKEGEVMERLKQLRISNKLYQKDVAEKIGVDRSTYVKYENGQSEPNFEILKRLADLFNVSIDYLLGHDDKKKEPAKVDELDEMRSKLLKIYNSASEEEKKVIFRIVETLAHKGVDTDNK